MNISNDEAIYCLFEKWVNTEDGAYGWAFVSCDAYNSTSNLCEDIKLYGEDGIVCLQKAFSVDGEDDLTCESWIHIRTYFTRDGVFRTNISGSTFEPKEPGLHSVVDELRNRVIGEAISERHCEGLMSSNLPTTSDRRYAISGYTTDGKYKVFLVVNPKTLSALDELSIEELRKVEFKLHEDVIVFNLFLRLGE